MDSVENIFRLDFAIRQLNNAMNAVTCWMAGEEPSLAEFGFVERSKLAVKFFSANPAHIMISGDYLNLILAIDKLTRDHADYVAGHYQGDTTSMREEARGSLNRLADVIDGLGYSEKTAERLRVLAGKN